MRLKLAASLLLFTYSAFGQAAAGTAGISGIVRDPSGSSIPGSKVVISNTGQGVIRSLSTIADGVITAPTLTPDQAMGQPSPQPVLITMRPRTLCCAAARTSISMST